MIHEERDGPALVITLARSEKKNALSKVLLEALATAMARASDDQTVRAVVLSHEGPVFAAGGDLDEIAGALQRERGAAEVLALAEHIDSIGRCDVPVIAAIGGDVYGGGCELVLACDLAAMERGKTLSFKHARMGLSPAWGGTARLLERAGPPRAARALFTAETVDATAALEMGIVSEVVSPGSARARALEIANAIAISGRAVIRAQKRLLRELREPAWRAAKEREDAAFESLWGGPDHRHAMARFEKK